MKLVELKYSKATIDKAGEKLKEKKLESSALNYSMEILSNWRAYHVMPLDTFAKVLKKRVKKIDVKNNAIVAQRLKRTPSILLKLTTHRTMRLSTMQDIGGLRAIFDTVKEVYDLVELYRKSQTKHHLHATDDYINSPKVDGYRGVHLVYKLEKEPKIFLEIQVRSYLQHIWATGVEVFGTLKNSSFKSGYGSKKWLDFFCLLSSIFAIKENTPVVDKHKGLRKEEILSKAKDLIKELQVIEQLNVYTEVYRVTTAQYKKAKKGRKGSYNLLILNSKDNTISVKTFSSENIVDATLAYMQEEMKYYKNKNINVVLVNTGDIRKLEVSYPNYFMDTNMLVKILSSISLDRYI